MALETATYISGLVNTNPAATDAKSQGDDHLRLLKSTLLNTFPAITGAVTPTHTELNYVAGVTSAIQTQFTNITGTLIPAKGAITGQAWTGTHDYTGATVTVAAPTAGANPATKTYADSLAFSAALPAQTGNAGKFVTTDGSSASWAYAATLGSNSFTGAQNEAHGADIASASTINLTTATGNLVDVTGTTEITAITLAEGAERTVRFTGALTLTNGASLVLPSGASITTAAGDFAVFRGYSGGVVRCVTYSRASGYALVDAAIGDHEVYVTTQNGHGSTNTKIQRFSVTQRSVGTDITYADDAANGASFTINTSGMYAIEYCRYQLGGAGFGISKNSAELTTNISTITASNRLGFLYQASATDSTQLAVCVQLAAADVIRPHDFGTNGGAGVYEWFRIKRVA